MSKLGALFRSRRGELRLTQRQVAERTGLHQQRVSLLERGHEPLLRHAVAMAAALDLEWESVLAACRRTPKRRVM